MDPAKKPLVSNTGAWAMNIVSSVGIIMANKQLMSSGGYGFCFGIISLHIGLNNLVTTMADDSSRNEKLGPHGPKYL